MNDEDIRTIVRTAIEEYSKTEQTKHEERSQNEVVAERQKREALQKQLDDVMAESSALRYKAEEAERGVIIRSELQRLGVRNVDLAYRAVRDEVKRGEDGRFKGSNGEDLCEFLTKFARENPELLPARLPGGSGAAPGQRASPANETLDLDKIRPGMNPEELERMRQEIARVALQTMRGL